MRRVLLIAFAYPPVEIIGSLRPAALVKYLPRFGWEAVVLTPRVEGTSREKRLVFETGYRDVLAEWKSRLRVDPKRSVHAQFRLAVANRPQSVLPHTRMLNWIKYFLTYPDETKGWIPFALEGIEQIRRKNLHLDAIVTTSPPISGHLIGREARKILGCPWIADFRDLWTQNHGERTALFLQRGLEKRTLSGADALVAVSTPWADRLQRRYPGKKVFTIPNGFDPDDFSFAAPPLTREFSITYAGQLYQGQRDPTLLFEALRDLLAEGAISASDLRVRFFGPVENWLPALARKYGLDQAVEIHGPQPRRFVLEREMESQILLVLPWSDPRETGHHSAKLFEYFAAARPVLAVGGSRGVLTEALAETQAGVHALTNSQVRGFLLASYAEYKTRGSVPYSGNKQAIERYSHPEMARAYAQVLDQLAGREGEPPASEGLTLRLHTRG